MQVNHLECLIITSSKSEILPNFFECILKLLNVHIYLLAQGLIGFEPDIILKDGSSISLIVSLNYYSVVTERHHLAKFLFRERFVPV
jgi:hypothetical protein